MRELCEKNYIHTIEVPINEIKHIDFAMCKDPKETISQYYDRQEVKPDIICNAGYFALKNGVTVFNYIDEHERKSSDRLYKWGIGTTDNTNLVYGSIDDGTDYKDFMCGYPVLLDNGEIQDLSYASDIAAANPRTALGYNEKYVYIVTIDGRQTDKPGMTLNQLAEYMQSIGCAYAINLDGGGSSRCHIGDRVVNSPTENRAVDSILAIYLKVPTNEVKYSENDTVYFTGGSTYSSSVGGSSKERQASFCTITRVVSAKHGVHLVSLPGESSVCGWADKENIRHITKEEQAVLNLTKDGIISDKNYWLSIVHGETELSVENLVSLMNNMHEKINK